MDASIILSFFDDYSKYTWIEFLHSKSEAFDAFKRFKIKTKNLLGTKVKNLHSDWGVEYRTSNQFLLDHGIHFLHSCPHAHHQNGSAERKYRHIVESRLTLLPQASFPLHF